MSKRFLEEKDKEQRTVTMTVTKNKRVEIVLRNGYKGRGVRK